MATYTVKNAMAAGPSSPQFGTEYYVQFEEMEDTATLWFKKTPEAGSTLDLEKVNGKWKKVKKEWNQTTAGNGTAKTPTATPARREFDTDGVRVGMCINNAANYVNALKYDKPLTDKEWAETVVSYAKALYAISEFHKPVTPENVAAVFGD